MMEHNRDQILFHRLCPIGKVLNSEGYDYQLYFAKIKQLVLKGLVRIRETVRSNSNGLI